VTLTIASGGIGNIGNQNNVRAITGGTVTSGTNELYVATGNVNSGGGVAINSKLTGSFDLVKSGVTPLTIGGSGTNDFVGTTYVNQGHLAVAMAGAGAVGLPGNLVIRTGGSANLSGSAAISAASSVTVDDEALLVLGNQTIGGILTVNGGRVYFLNDNPVLSSSGTGLAFNGGRFDQNSSSGTYALSLQTDVSYASSSTKPASFQRLGGAAYVVELDGAERTFAIADSATLPAGVAEMLVDTVIADGSGTGSLKKTGAGTLRLTGANTYSGGTTVNGGTVSVSTIAAAAQSGLTAVAQGGGSSGYILTFLDPITGTMAVGQTVTATGLNATLVGVLNEYEALIDRIPAVALLTNVALGAVCRTGRLGTGAVVLNDSATLAVDAGIAVSNSVTVNAGGRLAASGATVGSVALNGGTLVADPAAGALAVTGAAALASATLELTGPLPAAPVAILMAHSLTGSFVSRPAGCTVSYTPTQVLVGPARAAGMTVRIR
jgi:autotransporter-associated beta strand protein